MVGTMDRRARIGSKLLLPDKGRSSKVTVTRPNPTGEVTVTRTSIHEYVATQQRFQEAYVTTHNEVMAISALAMVPLARLFVLFQLAFLRGITLSGLKD